MLADFISLFFPRYCQSCEESLVKEEQWVCLKCLHRLPKTESHHHADNFISQKFYGKIPLDHAIAWYVFRKGTAVSRLLRKLKYQNMPDLGIYLGQKYGAELKNAGYDTYFDLIVPVPLHPSKFRRRGYNQSEKFAKGLAASMCLPMITISVARIRSTTSQTNKSRIERWKNVRFTFSVTKPALLVEKRVLLVDDVVTTGATLEACGHAILQAGVSSLSIATLAAAR